VLTLIRGECANRGENPASQPSGGEKQGVLTRESPLIRHGTHPREVHIKTHLQTISANGMTSPRSAEPAKKRGVHRVSSKGDPNLSTRKKDVDGQELQ
jgi:hypothetical protein